MEEFSLKVKLERTPTAEFVTSISKATEKDLSSVIEVLEAHLDLLYTHRRGKLIGTTTHGHEIVAWCSGCGKVKICPSDGIDTCQKCCEMV